MAGNKKLSVTGLILRQFAFPLFLLVIGGTAVLESMRVTKKYPSDNWLAGPSGFMMIIGVILLLLFVIELVKAIRGFSLSSVKEEAAVEKQSEKNQEDAINTKKMVLSFLLLVVYVLLLKILGFSLSSVLYLAANLWLLKNPPLRTIITVVVIFLLLMFGAPQLGISLPRGIFGF